MHTISIYPADTTIESVGAWVACAFGPKADTYTSLFLPVDPKHASNPRPHCTDEEIKLLYVFLHFLRRTQAKLGRTV